ncbi:hypothetical protein VTO42DRAFT_1093 [Malbranchea cinnamomea]
MLYFGTTKGLLGNLATHGKDSKYPQPRQCTAVGHQILTLRQPENVVGHIYVTANAGWHPITCTCTIHPPTAIKH